VDRCSECGGRVASGPLELARARLSSTPLSKGVLCSLLLFLCLMFNKGFVAVPINAVVRSFTPTQMHFRPGTSAMLRTAPVTPSGPIEPVEFWWEFKSIAIARARNQPAGSVEAYIALRTRHGYARALLLRHGGRIPDRRRDDILAESERLAPIEIEPASAWRPAIERLFDESGIDLNWPVHRSHLDAVQDLADAVLADPSDVANAGITLMHPLAGSPRPLPIGGGGGPVYFDIRDAVHGWVVIFVSALVSLLPAVIAGFVTGLHRIVWADVRRDARAEWAETRVASSK
jgi:hypothetical protein